MNQNQNIWVIIPAAGIGRRMDSHTPKQYLLLNNKTVIEHTIKIFELNTSVNEIVVVISKEDEFWPSLNISCSKPLHQTVGGRERCHTVLNGLKFLKDRADPTDWVLVHDAARPCLRTEDLDLLLNKLIKHDVGGILAVPVHDTIKRSGKRAGKRSENKFGNRSENRSGSQNNKQARNDTSDEVLISKTVDRKGLWQALTPQMFRCGLLTDAIESALANNQSITDDASAIELAGYQPILIEGHADNIKVTRPEDLAMAAFFLRQQKENR